MRLISIVFAAVTGFGFAAYEGVHAQDPPAIQSAPGASSGGVEQPIGKIPACDKPGGLGLSRIVEIDTTGGPDSAFKTSSNTIFFTIRRSR